MPSWEFDLEHEGTIATEQVEIVFVGPISRPRVSNLTTGDWILVERQIAADERLVLDCYARTVHHEGVSAIADLSDGPNRYLRLELGRNRIRIEAEAGGGSVQIRYRPAYA